MERVDLDSVVIASTAPFMTRTGPRIDGSGIEPAAVDGDAADLGRLVAGLVDNAVRHAATRVLVGCFPTEGGVRLTVCDDGPGIADAGAVFGLGTGLTEIRRIAEIHRGTVAIEPSAVGARLVVDLPRSSA
ncbi:MAG: HAMP domain-containing sensor histidine kinase [Acidimicrobiia bacterium]|nr:HAMP domain-containing sensor histidine kinase [Acidimicrobiia bacterium]